MNQGVFDQPLVLHIAAESQGALACCGGSLQEYVKLSMTSTSERWISFDPHSDQDMITVLTWIENGRIIIKQKS